jgi:hypothetical protein
VSDQCIIIVAQSFPKYLKLVEIAMIHVFFLLRKHCFNLVSFLKKKLCNSLNPHLELVVAMYSKKNDFQACL